MKHKKTAKDAKASPFFARVKAQKKVSPFAPMRLALFVPY